MLIVNDEHCLRAGIKSLSKRCTRVSWGNEITIFQANREKNKWEFLMSKNKGERT